jgi:uncharacterized protein YndB with AHSA1/START domain
MAQAPHTLIVTTPSDLEIRMTRTFDAPRQLVFDAWTRPEHMRRWLGRRGDTMPVCEIDLRVGGGYRVVWRLREGGEMGMHGVYKEIVPPERLVSTEVFEGPEFEAMGGESLNTLVLEEHDGRTLMTITSLYQSREARDGVLRTGMEKGAGESFDRLEELLRTLA